MSLTGALNAARSGMSTTSRWAQTTSSNISNANNAAYSRRTTVMESSASGGVTVSEITRAVSSSLDGQYRDEVSRTGTQDASIDGCTPHGDAYSVALRRRVGYNAPMTCMGAV